MLTPFQMKLLRRGLVPSGTIWLSHDAPFAISEAAELRMLAAQGLVRRGAPAKDPPRPGSWFLTDAGRDALTSHDDKVER
jgi:hypothetical protein